MGSREQILHQFTAVSITGRGLLIQGATGTGKTSLALALIDRGAKLIGDDGVALSLDDGQLIASPPEATRGLIEIRNVSIASLPITSAPAALILTTDNEAPRYVEKAGTKFVLGISVPNLPFTVTGSSDAIRAEYALRLHGLP